jgi:hypothetical protein
VGDSTSISVFWKSFPAAGVDALIGLEGMYLGSGMNDSLRLEDVSFVRAEAGRRRGHAYMPHDEESGRLEALAEAPPVVYSEVTGDLWRIVGQNPGGEGEDPVGGGRPGAFPHPPPLVNRLSIGCRDPRRRAEP